MVTAASWSQLFYAPGAGDCQQDRGGGAMSEQRKVTEEMLFYMTESLQKGITASRRAALVAANRVAGNSDEPAKRAHLTDAAPRKARRPQHHLPAPEVDARRSARALRRPEEGQASLPI